MNSELQGMWRNAVTDCFELFSRYFPGGQGTRENDAHLGGGFTKCSDIRDESIASVDSARQCGTPKRRENYTV